MAAEEERRVGGAVLIGAGPVERQRPEPQAVRPAVRAPLAPVSARYVGTGRHELAALVAEPDRKELGAVDGHVGAHHLGVEEVARQHVQSRGQLSPELDELHRHRAEAECQVDVRSRRDHLVPAVPAA